MNDSYYKVMEFHKKFGSPTREHPELLTPERMQKRCKWMREEIDEFEIADDICSQADAMIDLIYFALGTLVEMGVKPEEIFDIVHEANMSKLGADGNPIRNDEGKVEKPADWVDPCVKIKEAIDRMYLK